MIRRSKTHKALVAVQAVAVAGSHASDEIDRLAKITKLLQAGSDLAISIQQIARWRSEGIDLDPEWLVQLTPLLVELVGGTRVGIVGPVIDELKLVFVESSATDAVALPAAIGLDEVDGPKAVVAQIARDVSNKPAYCFICKAMLHC